MMGNCVTYLRPRTRGGVYTIPGGGTRENGRFFLIRLRYTDYNDNNNNDKRVNELLRFLFAIIYSITHTHTHTVRYSSNTHMSPAKLLQRVRRDNFIISNNSNKQMHS